MIISASISPPDGTILATEELRFYEEGNTPLPLSLVESKLLLDVRYRSAENMLVELITVRKFN